MILGGVGGRGGLDWEFGTSRCKLLFIEWINNKVLFYNTGDYIQYHIINHNGKGKKKKDDSVSQYLGGKAFFCSSFNQNYVACLISLFALPIRNVEILLFKYTNSIILWLENQLFSFHDFIFVTSKCICVFYRTLPQIFPADGLIK